MHARHPRITPENVQIRNVDDATYDEADQWRAAGHGHDAEVIGYPRS